MAEHLGPSKSLKPGTVLIHGGNTKASATLLKRKDDDSGWWCVEGGGLADAVIEDETGAWSVVPSYADDGFRPWDSIEAGDLKAEYSRAVEALHASRMRAFLLSVRLDAAEQVCELADVYMGSAPTLETRRPLGVALVKWRKMVDAG